MDHIEELQDQLRAQAAYMALSRPCFVAAFILLPLAALGYVPWSWFFLSMFAVPFLVILGANACCSYSASKRLLFCILAVGWCGLIWRWMGAPFSWMTNDEVLRASAPILAFGLGSILTTYRWYGGSRGWGVWRVFYSSWPSFLGIVLTCGAIALTARYSDWWHLAVTIVGGLHVSLFGMNIFRSWSQAALLLGPGALLFSYCILQGHTVVLTF
jgi:hypothetical protein